MRSGFPARCTALGSPDTARTKPGFGNGTRHLLAERLANGPAPRRREFGSPLRAGVYPAEARSNPMPRRKPRNWHWRFVAVLWRSELPVFQTRQKLVVDALPEVIRMVEVASIGNQQQASGQRIQPSPLPIQLLGLTSTGLQNAAPAAQVPNYVSTFRSVAAVTSAEPTLLVPLLRRSAALGRCRAFSCGCGAYWGGGPRPSPRRVVRQ
jgi:hypothetical protein